MGKSYFIGIVHYRIVSILNLAIVFTDIKKRVLRVANAFYSHFLCRKAPIC